MTPHSPDIELALIGRLLADPAKIAEVTATLLDGAHFHTAAGRMLYNAVVEAFYADDPVDALVIGEQLARSLSKVWRVDERAAVQKVVQLADGAGVTNPVEYARIIKRDADYRRLLHLADSIRARVEVKQESPEEIAGTVGQEALEVATSAVMNTQELVPFIDVGKQFVRDVQRARAARERGLEVGAWFNLRAIDDFTHGLQGGELAVCAGEPGVGKSSVWWKAGLNFAKRQAKLEQQVATLIVSLEMSPTPSAARFASMLAGVSGTDLREGRITDEELQRVVKEFRELHNVPLWLNYAPTLKASQMRALIAEAIRRHNVGLVIIDHFRMFDLDQRLHNKNDEDEEKVRFLKEQIALSMNVAVVCLAHTRKPDPASNGRPKMSDLRGSYQVAAHSDFVSFVFRPSMYADKHEIESGEVRDTQAEMIWAKNRHGNPGSKPFYFSPQRMFIRDETPMDV